MPLFERRPVTEIVNAIQLRWDNVHEVIAFILENIPEAHIRVYEPSANCSKLFLNIHSRTKFRPGLLRFCEGFWIFFIDAKLEVLDDATFRKTYRLRQS